MMVEFFREIYNILSCTLFVITVIFRCCVMLHIVANLYWSHLAVAEKIHTYFNYKTRNICLIFIKHSEKLFLPPPSRQ